MFGFAGIGRLKAALRRRAGRAVADRRRIALLKEELRLAAAQLGACEARWREQALVAEERAADLQRLRVAYRDADRDLQRLRNDRLGQALARGGVATSAMVDGRW